MAACSWMGAVRPACLCLGLIAGLVGCGGGGETTAATPVPAPTIATQPSALTVLDGQSAAFSVAATGSGLSYQWQRNQADISGATSATLSLPTVALADSGALLRVRVSNVSGQVTSSEVGLTVNPVAPAIDIAPAPAAVVVGQTASFSVTAHGSAPLTYQWQRDGVDIGGATSSTYTTPATVLGDNGASLQVVVSNAGGNVTSSSALLSVTVAPTVPALLSQPAAISVNAGQTATFTVQAAGGVLSYQWKRNGLDIGGATLATYTTPVLVASDSGAQYSVTVTNAQGPVTSTVATLSVLLAPPTGPVPVQTRVAVSEAHSVVVKADGTSLNWGAFDSLGFLGSGPVQSGTNARSVATSAVSVADVNGASLALGSNGAATGWGNNSLGVLGGLVPLGSEVVRTPQAVAFPSGVRQLVSANFGFVAVALMPDGSLSHMAGTRALAGTTLTYGAATVVGINNVASLSARGYPNQWLSADPQVGVFAVVATDGTVWHLRYTRNSSPALPVPNPVSVTQVSGLTGIVSVSCGGRTCLALNASGEVFQWAFGLNPVKKAGLPVIRAVAACSDGGLVQANDGNLYTWGNADQLGRTVVGVRDDTPALVPGLADVTDFACHNHVLAVRGNGDVWGWGFGHSGELGLGVAGIVKQPVKIAGINLN